MSGSNGFKLEHKNIEYKQVKIEFFQFQASQNTKFDRAAFYSSAVMSV